MDVHPSLNQPIQLIGEDGEEYPSRVEGVDDGRLTVARPFGLPPETTMVVGAVVELGWATDLAAFRRPVRVLDSKREGSVPLWDIETVGPAVKIQRRAHVRVPVGSPMTIVSDDVTVAALLVDVSEAALRSRVELAQVPAREDADQPDPLAVGQPVTVSFSLAGTAFSLPAAVYRNDEIGAGRRELVLPFVIDESQATDVRKAIFAEQIRLRQLRTDR
ncbi:MAG TPA: PilZ domain-containing protein [Nocardioides sp.]|uniref:PilZ domain-containing protein n=1 Tax=Nocardioides sp. TaxID=35761 RepID=UPI002ED86DF7